MNGRSTGSFIRHNNSNISNKSTDAKNDSAGDSWTTRSNSRTVHLNNVDRESGFGEVVRESLVKGNKGIFLEVNKDERLLSRTCSLQQ